MSGLKNSSKTTGDRQSNFELLRIVSMFLVLIFHADFWSLGWPKQHDLIAEPLPTIVKTIFEAIAVVCVNSFILISGWFGIRPSKKGLCNYIFQCIYFLAGIYAFTLLTGQAKPSINGLLGCIALTQKNWFILAYLFLYILSPVLNDFVNHSSRTTFRNVLIGYFTLQTIYGMTNAAEFINYGYSTMSFMGLYLLARYLNIYGIPEYISKHCAVIYWLSVVCNSILFIVLLFVFRRIHIFCYVNPIVIAGAVGMFVFFKNLKIATSPTINFVSASSFAVFLLHTNPNIGKPIFQPLIRNIYESTNGLITLLGIAIVLLLTYVLAILLDQPRKLLWQKIKMSFFTH